MRACMEALCSGGVEWYVTCSALTRINVAADVEWEHVLSLEHWPVCASAQNGSTASRKTHKAGSHHARRTAIPWLRCHQSRKPPHQAHHPAGRRHLVATARHCSRKAWPHLSIHRRLPVAAPRHRTQKTHRAAGDVVDTPGRYQLSAGTWIRPHRQETGQRRPVSGLPAVVCTLARFLEFSAPMRASGKASAPTIFSRTFSGPTRRRVVIIASGSTARARHRWNARIASSTKATGTSSTA